jgi:hypothetical protein
MEHTDFNGEREIGGLLADIKNIKEMILRMQEKDNEDHKRLAEELDGLREEIKTLTRDLTWGKAFIAIIAFLGGIAYFIVGEIRNFLAH